MTRKAGKCAGGCRSALNSSCGLRKAITPDHPTDVFARRPGLSILACRLGPNTGPAQPAFGSRPQTEENGWHSQPAQPEEGGAAPPTQPQLHHAALAPTRPAATPPAAQATDLAVVPARRGGRARRHRRRRWSKKPLPATSEPIRGQQVLAARCISLLLASGARAAPR